MPVVFVQMKPVKILGYMCNSLATFSQSFFVFRHTDCDRVGDNDSDKVFTESNLSSADSIDRHLTKGCAVHKDHNPCLDTLNDADDEVSSSSGSASDPDESNFLSDIEEINKNDTDGPFAELVIVAEQEDELAVTLDSLVKIGKIKKDKIFYNFVNDLRCVMARVQY